MKSKLLLSLCCANALAQYSVATETQDTGTQPTGNLESNILFQANDLLEQVEGRTIIFSLYQDEKLLGNVLLSQAVTAVGGYPVTVTPVLGTEGRILSYQILLEDLEEGQYQIALSGKYHTDYKSEPIFIDDTSKQLNISTQSTDFAYGDLNGDQRVDKTDLNVMQYHVSQNNHQYDLTGDGAVDITDLALIKLQLGATDSAVLLETVYNNPLSLLNLEETLEALENVATVEGDFSQLFSSNHSEAVILTPLEGAISDTAPLSFPLVLDAPQELSQILLSSTTEEGALEEGYVEVVYETSIGEEVTEIIPFTTDSRSDLTRTVEENIIVISLGERVVVKTITVTVTKVSGDEFAVLTQVNFVKDLVPEDPSSSNGIVTQVEATGGDEKVSLSWSAVNNVSAYRVYYGTSRGNYSGTLNTTALTATVTGLENFQNYYFAVSSTHDDWSSGYSQEVSAQPLPSSKPGATTFLEANPIDQGASLRWQSNSKASSYRIYYRKSSDFTYQLGGTTSNTSFYLGGLENDEEYILYITGVNSVGEGTASNVLTVIPEKEKLEGPSLPTEGRIPNAAIIDITMEDPNNVKSELYPNGFDISYVADDDYATDWVANLWYLSSSLFFTLDDAYDMSYVAYIGKLEGDYRSSLSHATVSIWTDEDDLEGDPSIVHTDSSIRYTNLDGESIAIIDFPRSNVVKIKIMVAQWNGSPTNVSLSEIAFYEHNPIADDISALFSNNTYTRLYSRVTQETIDALREQVDDMGEYIVNRDILSRELDMADSLLQGEESQGILLTSFDSIDNSLCDISPLGVLAYAGEQMTIYASIPQGETIEILPSQYYSEAFAHLGTGILLENGRNIITVEQLTSINVSKGGPLYYRYSGEQGDKITLHVQGRFNSSGAADIVVMPVLALYDFYDLTETQIKNRITTYLEELETFVAISRNTLSLNPSNSTEISLRNVLLSLPASEVYSGLQNHGSFQEQVEGLYQSILAWEELLMICNLAYGLEDYENPRQARQNIRYMRMSDTAFMYAGGNHIGIQYGSVSALVQGKPTSLTGAGSANALYGWGIAHEIGHNLDRLGRAEITNNIYSLLAQTYDGAEAYNSSRLSGMYPEIYSKVTSGNLGIANNVFVQLGMYWQLQQAYCGEDPLLFYQSVNKAYKNGENTAYSGDQRFAVTVSHIVQQDLSAFFTAWGVDLSDNALLEMSQYPRETRNIQYFNDDSREYRLTGGSGFSSNSTGTLSAVPSSENIKEVNLVYQHPFDSDDLLGFEFYRNGRLIAFQTTGFYTDTLGSLNNASLEYSVRAIDKLGYYVGADVKATEIRIEYDNEVDSSLYTVTQEGGQWKFTFPTATTLSGVIFREEEEGTNFTVEVLSETGSRLSVCTGTVTETVDKSLHYFQKQNVTSTDTRIGVYDVTELWVSGIEDSDNIAFLSYIGDNVQFMEQAVGVLGADFDTGAGVIEEGTMIILGEYLGDPYFTEITLMGQFAHSHGIEEDIEYIQRPFSGTTYLIAYETETVSTISDGLFLFVPDIQQEYELQEGDVSCTHMSLFPSALKAIMERSSDTGNYQTSDTLWTTVPTEDSLPVVYIE